MPYILLFSGVILGVLSMSWGTPMLSIFLAGGVLLLYFILADGYNWSRWLSLFVLGSVLGSLSGLKLIASPPVTGDICTGYALREYTRSMSVRVDSCAQSVQRSGIYYISCGNSRCPKIYSRVKIQISDLNRLGRFMGKGVILEAEQKESDLYKKTYFLFMSKGYQVKLEYFAWLRRKLPLEQASLVSSMLFGDTELPADLTKKMKEVGLLHIVAISGINIAYLLELINNISRKFSRKIATLIEVIILIMLFLIVGEAVSLMRAMIMSFWGIFTRRVGLMSTPWAFMVGLSVLLLLDPRYLWDAGFLLVSGACFGIYLGGQVLRKWLKSSTLIELVQGIVIWICVAPIQYFIFGTVTVWGMILGFVTSPLIEILTLFGYLSSVLRVVPHLESILTIILGAISSLILLVINMFHTGD